MYCGECKKNNIHSTRTQLNILMIHYLMTKQIYAALTPPAVPHLFSIRFLIYFLHQYTHRALSLSLKTAGNSPVEHTLITYYTTLALDHRLIKLQRLMNERIRIENYVGCSGQSRCAYRLVVCGGANVWVYAVCPSSKPIKTNYIFDLNNMQKCI